MNARFNGYFYADQYLNEVYQQLEDNYQYNFNEVLDIFPEIDSSSISSNKEKLDDAFKKSSQIIEWYKSSDWVDDAYLLIGKIRHLRAEFQFAIETFQYINTTSKDNDMRHKALIALMRTYIDMRSLDFANEVSNVLELNEELNNENKLEYRVVKAYLRQVEGDEAGMLSALSGIDQLIQNRDQRFRTSFILGQLSEKNGELSDAYTYFDKVTKGTPPYELLFHARLNKMVYSDYKSEASLDKAYKDFNKMLDDRKNFEYQDIIYYAMGQVEQKRENFKGAIENYGLATTVEQPNQRQQGLSYLRIGEIYYDEYQNFKQSSLYYDSAVSKLTESEKGYVEIKERQVLLKDFVTQLNVIDLNDSLLSLAEMNPVSLDAFLDRYLDERDADAREALKKSKEKKSIRPTSTNADVGSEGWYFYNSAAINQGQLEFQRQWGNRPLEDNWRRSSKIASGFGINTDALDASAGEEEEEAVEENIGDSRSAEKDRLKAEIPYKADEKENLGLEMADAYFNLGRIYRLGFEDNDQSIESYKTLLSRFPETKHRLDALFSLYTLYLDKDASIAEEYKQQIIREFPETQTAKLLVNPRYLEEKAERTRQLEAQYSQAYNLYESGSFLEAERITRNILSSFEDVDFLPTVELLAAILKAKTESIVSYEQALDQYIAKYPENNLVSYAKQLKEAINPQKEQVISSLGSEYSEDFQQIHLIIILFDSELNSKEEIKKKVEAFNTENFANQFLSIGEIGFDEGRNLEVLFVNPLKTKTAAERYNDALDTALNNMNLSADDNFSTFEISRDNFTKLFGTKNLEEYLNFNKRFYK